MSLPIFLTAEWRSLLMLSFEIEPAVLIPYLPAGTELDLWHGQALVSLVGFQFFNTRLHGWSIPGHRHFDEVNLRFYVRCQTPDGERRGVVFIKEVAPRRAIVWVARGVYHENYVYGKLRHDIERPEAPSATGWVRYAWRHRQAWLTMAAEIQGTAMVSQPGSIEEFITEHYWGYTRRTPGETWEYEVQHPAWKVWTATATSFSGDAVGFYGPAFAAALQTRPVSGLVAEGSPVQVHCGRPLPVGLKVGYHSAGASQV